MNDAPPVDSSTALGARLVVMVMGRGGGIGGWCGEIR
jgi:hypothetical protein